MLSMSLTVAKILQQMIINSRLHLIKNLLLTTKVSPIKWRKMSVSFQIRSTYQILMTPIPKKNTCQSLHRRIKRKMQEKQTLKEIPRKMFLSSIFKEAWTMTNQMTTFPRYFFLKAKNLTKVNRTITRITTTTPTNQ